MQDVLLWWGTFVFGYATSWLVIRWDTGKSLVPPPQTLLQFIASPLALIPLSVLIFYYCCDWLKDAFVAWCNRE